MSSGRRAAYLDHVRAELSAELSAEIGGEERAELAEPRVRRPVRYVRARVRPRVRRFSGRCYLVSPWCLAPLPESAEKPHSSDSLYRE